MASKVQLTSTGAPTATAATVNANPGKPPILIGGAATSRVPSANFESIALKKDALQKIARAINDNTIAVRRAVDGGGQVKITPPDVQVVLAALIS
jgi:hypothetical protein